MAANQSEDPNGKARRIRRIAWLLALITFASAALSILALWVVYGVGRSPDERVSITAYGDPISAALYMPDGALDGAIVICHGNRPAGGSHPLYRALAAELSRDRAVLNIDMSGFGDSPPRDGEFLASVDFSDNVIAGARYVADRLGMDVRDVVLVGHSLGSWQVVNAGNRLRSRLVFSMGAGDAELLLAKPEEQKKYIEKVRRHTGMRIDPERIAEAVEPIRLDSILRACAIEELVFVYSDSERHSIQATRAAVRRAVTEPGLPCRVSFEILPGTDHMYGTESLPFPKRVCAPLRLCPSQDVVAQLASRLRTHYRGTRAASSHMR